MLEPVPRVDSLAQLSAAAAGGAGEVIVCMADFARTGQLSHAAGVELARAAWERGVRPLLQWDLLMTERVLQKKIRQISPLLDRFSALRVQDPGALQWALECVEHGQLSLHWIAEGGNHNLVGLQKWVELIGPRLGRLVLSMQIPAPRLQHYARQLPCPLELLGIGRLLLFYTPRHLLEQFGRAEEEDIRLLASSEESAHNDLPVLSNRHGTFLFHQKHLWLLEQGAELEHMGITHLRLEVSDHRLLSQALRLLQNPVPAFLRSFDGTTPPP